MVFPLPHTSSLNRFHLIKKPLFFCMSVTRERHCTAFFAEKKMTVLKDLFPLLVRGRPGFTVCGQKILSPVSAMPMTSFNTNEIARHSAGTVFHFLQKNHLLLRLIFLVLFFNKDV